MRVNIVQAFRDYQKDPARWWNRYQEACSPKEDTMTKAKVIFRFHKGKGKHKFRWSVDSCNGNLMGSSEGMLSKLSPRKAVNSIIDAVRSGNYKIEEEYVED